MQIVAKLYENIRSTTPYNQVFIESEVSIDYDLMTFWVANLSIPFIETISKNNKIELYEVNDIWNDTKIFSWYIYNLTPIRKKFDTLQIEARSDKGIFDNRKLLFYKKFFEANYKVGSKPSYPTWDVFKTYLIDGAIYTLKGTATTETGTTYYIRSPPTALPVESYVYISNDNELRKRSAGALVSQWNTTWLDIKLVLQDMLDDYNNNYWESRTLDCNITEDIQLDLNLWDDYSSVLNELAWQLWALRNINNWVLIFQLKDNFWTDRTDKTKDSYEEVFFSWTQPTESNISNVVSRWSRQRKNILVAKSPRGRKEIIDSEYIDVVYGVDFHEFREWNFDSKTLAYIQDKNKDINDYSFEIEQNTITANIGDKLKLKIEELV